MCVFSYALVYPVLLLWPCLWPWPDNLDVRTWPRYSEDSYAYQKRS